MTGNGYESVGRINITSGQRIDGDMYEPTIIFTLKQLKGSHHCLVG